MRSTRSCAAPRSPRMRITSRSAIGRQLRLCSPMSGLKRRCSGRFRRRPTCQLRYCGPGEWLVVSQVDTPVGLTRRLDMLCGTQAHVVDQSDGRVLVRLSGPFARQILAKGIGVDLHPAAFALGDSTNVLCGHIGINLARTGENVIRADRFAQLCRNALRRPDGDGPRVRPFGRFFRLALKLEDRLDFRA